MDVLKKIGIPSSKAKQYLALIPKDISEVEYNRYLYQITGDLLEGKIPSRVGWEHDVYKAISEKEESYNMFVTNPVDVVEGVVACKCGSNKVFSYAMQSRSADEPVTTYSECTKCGRKFKSSG